MKHYVIVGIQDSYYGFSRPLMSFSDRENAQTTLDRLNRFVEAMDQQTDDYSSTVPMSWLEGQEDFRFLLTVEPNFLRRDGRSYSDDPDFPYDEEVYVPEPYELIEVEFAG